MPSRAIGSKSQGRQILQMAQHMLQVVRESWMACNRPPFLGHVNQK